MTIIKYLNGDELHINSNNIHFNEDYITIKSNDAVYVLNIDNLYGIIFNEKN